MNLSEKILRLRKQHGVSQEELAEKLNVSRQAISRWKMGSAQPDATNILQLSKLFNVTTDYLLNDEYDSDNDVPIVKQKEWQANKKISKVVGIGISLFGLIGNFMIYVLSRFIKVIIPYITYENGEKMYKWSSDLKGYSYKYFIQTYKLEFLTFIFILLFFVGLFIIFANGKKYKDVLTTLKRSK